MRALVTGGAGYIGSHTARELVRRGHAVEIADDLSRGHAAAVTALGLELHRVDLRDAAAADALLRAGRFDVVLHFAGLALVGESFERACDYYRTNLVASLNLLDAMTRHGPARFIFSSTCAVYGIPERTPIPEAHPLRPINPYGRTKLAVETALGDYALAHRIGSVALRYFNAAGASADTTLGEDHEPETHLIPNVLRAARAGRPVTVNGDDYDTPDGTCIRDYIHVEDLARAHALAIDLIVPGEARSVNVGTGRGASVREVIELARRVTGRPIAESVGPRRPGDPPILVADAREARARLGFTAERDLESMISSAWAWMTRARGEERS
jgi:UDP-glucose-4-epimerase GalE